MKRRRVALTFILSLVLRFWFIPCGMAYADDVSPVPTENIEKVDELVISGDSLTDNNMFDVYYEAEEESWYTLGGFLLKLREIMPYLGIALFVLGIVLFVFSTKNKGMKRFGIRMAIIEAVVTFGIYITVSLVYDHQCTDIAFGIEEKGEVVGRYEAVYYENLVALQDAGQNFVLMQDKWHHDAATAGRKYYMSAVPLFVFVSIGVGILFFLITKRDKTFRWWSIVGMCIILPAVLTIGYQYIKI